MKERSKEKGRGGGRNPRNRYARTGERMGGARAGFRVGMAKKKTRELGSMRAGKRKRLVRKRGWGRSRRARWGEEDDEENGEREKLEELAALFLFFAWSLHTSAGDDCNVACILRPNPVPDV